MTNFSKTEDSDSSGSFSSSGYGTALFLRKHLWIWPIVAAALLVVICWFVRSSVETAVKTTMEGNLRTILQAEESALRIWLGNQAVTAECLASADVVVQSAAAAARSKSSPPADDIPRTMVQEAPPIRGDLTPLLKAGGYQGYVLLNLDARVLASDRKELVGQEDFPAPAGMLETVKAGKPFVTKPFRISALLPDDSGRMRASTPMMFAAASVRDRSGKVIAALCLLISPENEFTQILSVARSGDSGETYAFDREGLLLSQSRFDEQLKQIGLLPDNVDTRSILNIELRDPQANMVLGERPVARRRDQPLTLMIADAAAGNTGANADGCRDYRGVPVIGAWTWLADLDIGLATQIDVDEAYRPLYILRFAFWGLFGLLAISAASIFVFTLLLSRLNRSLRRAAMKAQRLGQYVLEEKLGTGGMGIVYRARHGMLRRPTAVKLLDVDKTTDATIARFEREVQLTSQLTHPNTIAIYDYGRTPEGIFYYAMEYLDGISLEQLVKEYGPQPEARVVRILRQVCDSLAEAHAAGLIHRDIKPANIMLTRRGGVLDFVKVLDFGLVKSIDPQRAASVTMPDSIAGTPMYLAPETIQSAGKADARSDLYSVGAVGYFLVAGKTPFSGESIVEICMSHINRPPDRPSDHLGKPVSMDLENLILRCLAKDPGQRPRSAEELAEELDRCRVAGDWTNTDASAWWKRWQPAKTADQTEEATERSAYEETIIYQQGKPA
jgi:eukaryotic-like serine/threonine-protein kinase